MRPIAARSAWQPSVSKVDRARSRWLVHGEAGDALLGQGEATSGMPAWASRVYTANEDCPPARSARRGSPARRRPAGEIPVAHVVLRGEATADELLSRVAERVAPTSGFAPSS